MSRPTGSPLIARALILHFLSYVGEARVARVVRFMETAPIKVAPGTTRNVLSKLARQGRIERAGYGRYRRLTDREATE